MADRAHSTSRRALLAGLATSTALTVPVLAGDTHPDTELLDLWHRRGLAEAAAKAAGKRQDDLSDATPFPAPPEAVFVQAGDEAFGFLGLATSHGSGRLWYSVQAPGAGGRAGPLRRPRTRVVDEPFPEGHVLHGTDCTIGRRVAWPEAQARADAIVRAWDDWRAELDRIYTVSGLDVANAEWEALDDAQAELDGAIRDATAHTLDGLRIKARLAQNDLDDDTDPEPTLIAGLVRDILAMQAAA
ncbi:hypothetical protein MKK84_24785 [Methylobacterium sp. E-065]|uniref:hypothetical protein n=1 Tax=Methylobacterium sp. E-065 TaxID=2836583 RepID=UPI001FBBA1FF|nr:hypothetical protein [Methylobacterium sp. E-065]MCJ2020606.1 hypothetical protein [Methylobacterium sp. E-065]